MGLLLFVHGAAANAQRSSDVVQVERPLALLVYIRKKLHNDSPFTLTSARARMPEQVDNLSPA